MDCRVLRQRESDFIIQHSRNEPDATPINAALSYMEQYLNQPLDIDQLCKQACMSLSQYRKIKQS